MRVAIDLTSLAPPHTGVDNYQLRLFASLAKIDRTTSYTVFVNREDRAQVAALLSDNFRIVPLSLRPRPVRLGFQQVLLPSAAQLLGIDVVHSPSFIMPLIRGRQRHLLTVYDMTSFSLPECHIPLRRSAPYRHAVQASIRRADLVSVPSDATRQEVLSLIPELPPERIRVVRPGVGEEFRVRAPGEIDATRARLGLPQRYILYVGTIEPRKNLDLLVAAYRRLVVEHGAAEDLVLAGRLGWSYDGLLRQLEAPELHDRVHLIGYVSQEHLPTVYAGARLFVYPSQWEGFGFPPLEAMACGVPTIVTRSSSLVENLEGAAELVPVGDADALMVAMRQLLHDQASRTEHARAGLERAAEFRWEETARRTHACYEELATESPGRRDAFSRLRSIVR